jgi:hypothetical protein
LLSVCLCSPAPVAADTAAASPSNLLCFAWLALLPP